MTPLRTVLLFFAVLTVAVVGYATREGEVIALVANQDVPLLDPGTLAGKIGDLPTTIAVLKPGQSVPVVDCHDRKSDIDLVVSYQEGRQLPVAVSSRSHLLVAQRRCANLEQSMAALVCSSRHEAPNPSFKRTCLRQAA